MDGNLIHLVSDLLKEQEGRELRRLFNERPERLMDFYDLSADKRQCLYRMNPGHIATELEAEVAAWQKASQLPEIPTGSISQGDRLMHLVSDLMHSATLMEKLEDDPEVVLDHYRIGNAHREVLRKKDAGKIAAAIRTEGEDMTYPDPDQKDFPDGEEPACEELEPRSDGASALLYPAVWGKVWCARPSSPRAGEFPLVVFARSAPRDPLCAVRLEPTQGGDPIPASEAHVAGTFRKSIVRCRFTAPAGTYRVVVESCPNTRHAYVFGSDVEITVQ